MLDSLIICYVKCGHFLHAFSLFEKSVLDDDAIQMLDVSTFVALLKACAHLKDIDKGQEIHEKVESLGFMKNEHDRDIIGNAVIYMYRKCGSIANAQEVFDKLPSLRSMECWTSLIAGYVELGNGEKAIYYLEKMQQEGIFMDDVAYVCVLKACDNPGYKSKGQEIHDEIVKKGFDTCLVVGSTLVDMYAKHGSLPEAREVFKRIRTHDVVSWTALIGGYLEHGNNSEEAFNCFDEMQCEGLCPDAGTLVCCLKACGSIKSIEKGQKMHSNATKLGFDRDIFVGSSLVDVYCKCSLLSEAQVVLFMLPTRNTVLWTALITGYAELGSGEEVLYFFEEMQNESIIPCDVTYICCLKGCGKIGALVKGEKLHSEVVKMGYESEILVGNIVVDMYAKCGLLTEAREVFENLSVQTVVSWTALITGYAQLGESESVFLILNQMLEKGIKPNFVTFVNVLNVCSHAGLVRKGQEYFELLGVNDYGIVYTPEHYSCMVDLFARAGHISMAIELIKKMPFHPSIRFWLSVLGACRKWRNVELGRYAFEHAVKLDIKEPAVYVCMFNIYADAAMQDEANKVESMILANRGSHDNWWIEPD